MSRSWLRGGIPYSWEAQRPLVSYPALQVYSQILPSPLLFPVTHFLSLWVEGGERRQVGSRVGGCGAVRAGKVTHSALPSSSSEVSYDTSRGAALPPGRCLSQPH